MSDPEDRPRIAVRPVLTDRTRRHRLRDLVLAVAVCDALVVAIVLVGMAAGWAWWAIVAAGILPLGIGMFAVRAAIVVRRHTTRPEVG